MECGYTISDETIKTCLNYSGNEDEYDYVKTAKEDIEEHER